MAAKGKLEFYPDRNKSGCPAKTYGAGVIGMEQLKECMDGVDNRMIPVRRQIAVFGQAKRTSSALGSSQNRYIRIVGHVLRWVLPCGFLRCCFCCARSKI
jgi:hypothetical protein